MAESYTCKTCGKEHEEMPLSFAAVTRRSHGLAALLLHQERGGFPESFPQQSTDIS